MSSGAASGYRADIDGLRAVAVLLVVAFHLGLDHPSDGYVGVDVFFVISGFLITGLIQQDLEWGRFSFRDFYIRRTKRILPAFSVVTLATMAAGTFLLLPEDIVSLGKSAFASAFSAANVWFWYSEDSGYFARASELIPLLHTWSLGVEEQFYLTWPLLLYLGHRVLRTRGIVLISLAMAAASYACAQILLRTDPSFAYYMLPARAGELLTGSLACFLIRARRSPWPAPASEALSLGGAGLIVWSAFFADAGKDFPGWNALPPCLGTALVLAGGAGHRTAVSRLLSAPPLVYVGRISYSLYLWHWPVLAFARHLYTALSPGVLAACFLLTLALSVLSHHFVEEPFRRARPSPRKVFGLYLGAPSLALIVLALVLYRTEGLASAIAGNPSYQAALADREARTRPAYTYPFVCQTDAHGDSTFGGPRCVSGRKDSAPVALLWGDSHAAHHVGFLDTVASRAGYSFRNLAVGDCPPVFREAIGYGTGPNREECREFRRRIRGEIDAYATIFIGAAWSAYFGQPGFVADFEATLREIQDRGKRVILLGQVPRFEAYDRNCRLRNHRLLEVDCVRNARARVVADFDANDFLRSLAGRGKAVDYFDLGSQVCDPGCSPYRDGKPLYFDPEHLSIAGSRDLGATYAGWLLEEAPSGTAGLAVNPGTGPRR